jgi:RNA recognition motif-containing protein
MSVYPFYFEIYFSILIQVRLAVWNHTNQLKGFGYIEFKSEQSAEIAVKKSLSSEGITVKGRPVICDYETGQAKGSFKPRFDPSAKKHQQTSTPNSRTSLEEEEENDS